MHVPASRAPFVPVSHPDVRRARLAPRACLAPGLLATALLLSVAGCGSDSGYLPLYPGIDAAADTSAEASDATDAAADLDPDAADVPTDTRPDAATDADAADSPTDTDPDADTSPADVDTAEPDSTDAIDTDPTDVAEPDTSDVADAETSDTDPEDTSADLPDSDVVDTDVPDTDAPDTDVDDTDVDDTDAADADEELDSDDGDSGPGADPVLEAILTELRDGFSPAMTGQANDGGWPMVVRDGYLVVNQRTELPLVAGDFDGWSGTPMHVEENFLWAVVPMTPGQKYKFTDLTTWIPDPWSRTFTYDEYGEMSLLAGDPPRLDRWFGVGTGDVAPRALRVRVPADVADGVLYMHDGQNLFDPAAPWGGWRLENGVPENVLLVGIDNSPARMTEYTHSLDDIDGVGTGSDPMGGGSDEYAAFVHNVVRPFVRARYGEPDTVGLLGSSLGGLVSYHIAWLYPDEYDFVGSMSGTFGWGSIYLDTTTMMDLYASAPPVRGVYFIDSGGFGEPCRDEDGDGEWDDSIGDDNYCSGVQMRELLAGLGFEYDAELFHWWEEYAPHNEAMWAARVWRPLGIFSDLAAN